MCLAKVIRATRSPKRSPIRWVWKVFGGIGGELHSPLYGNRSYKRGKWIQDPRSINGMIRDSYPPGFHCFLRRKDAEPMLEWAGTQIVRIKARLIVAEGIQDEAKVIVAREIFIPKEKVAKKASK